ncbi:MAG: hypothetical protein JJT95_11215 [Pararhodobacter sp.]|nr:hypothetical protein [Pararhodobacter sp.]
MVAASTITRAAAALAMFMALALAPAAPALAMSQQEANALLRSDERVWGGLLNAAIIAHIVRECDHIEGPSRFARRAYFLPLYNHARRMGASRAQIEAFVEDEAEQARLEAEVYRYIESTGARPDDPASVCALGRAEIAARSPVGRRLTER